MLEPVVAQLSQAPFQALVGWLALEVAKRNLESEAMSAGLEPIAAKVADNRRARTGFVHNRLKVTASRIQRQV